MIRRRPLSRAVVPIIVRGASFTFRTLHAPDGRKFGAELTLDKVMTITLPAIRGLHHFEPASLEVVL